LSRSYACSPVSAPIKASREVAFTLPQGASVAIGSKTLGNTEWNFRVGSNAIDVCQPPEKNVLRGALTGTTDRLSGCGSRKLILPRKSCMARGRLERSAWCFFSRNDARKRTHSERGAHVTQTRQSAHTSQISSPLACHGSDEPHPRT